MTWRPLVALMVLLAILCMAGPHTHADSPQSAGVSSCDPGSHPHEHEASCDAPSAQPSAADAPALSQHGRRAAPSASVATAPAALPLPGHPDLLALLCVSRL